MIASRTPWVAFVGGAIQVPGHGYQTLVGFVLLLAAFRLVKERRSRSGAERPLRHLSVPLAIGAGGVIGM